MAYGPLLFCLILVPAEPFLRIPKIFAFQSLHQQLLEVEKLEHGQIFELKSFPLPQFTVEDSQTEKDQVTLQGGADEGTALESGCFGPKS